MAIIARHLGIFQTPKCLSSQAVHLVDEKLSRSKTRYSQSSNVLFCNLSSSFHCGSTFQSHSVCFPAETNKCIWGCEYLRESAIDPDSDPFKLKLMFCRKTHNVSPSITVFPRYNEALPSVRFVKYGWNFAVLIKWHVAVHFYVGMTKTDGFCVRRRHRYFLPPLLSGTDSRFRLFCPWRVTGLYRTSSRCLRGKKKKKNQNSPQRTGPCLGGILDDLKMLTL